MEQPINGRGLIVEYVKTQVQNNDFKYGRYAVLNNQHGGYVIEKFRLNGEAVSRQPRDTWDKSFDTRGEAIEYLDQYFEDMYL